MLEKIKTFDLPIFLGNHVEDKHKDKEGSSRGTERIIRSPACAGVKMKKKETEARRSNPRVMKKFAALVAGAGAVSCGGFLNLIPFKEHKNELSWYYYPTTFALASELQGGTTGDTSSAGRGGAVEDHQQPRAAGRSRSRSNRRGGTFSSTPHQAQAQEHEQRGASASGAAQESQSGVVTTTSGSGAAPFRATFDPLPNGWAQVRAQGSFDFQVTRPAARAGGGDERSTTSRPRSRSRSSRPHTTGTAEEPQPGATPALVREVSDERNRQAPEQRASLLDHRMSQMHMVWHNRFQQELGDSVESCKDAVRRHHESPDFSMGDVMARERGLDDEVGAYYAGVQNLMGSFWEAIAVHTRKWPEPVAREFHFRFRVWSLAVFATSMPREIYARFLSQLKSQPPRLSPESKVYALDADEYSRGRSTLWLIAGLPVGHYKFLKGVQTMLHVLKSQPVTVNGRPATTSTGGRTAPAESSSLPASGSRLLRGRRGTEAGRGASLSASSSSALSGAASSSSSAQGSFSFAPPTRVAAGVTSTPAHIAAASGEAASAAPAPAPSPYAQGSYVTSIGVENKNPELQVFLARTLARLRPLLDPLLDAEQSRVPELSGSLPEDMAAIVEQPDSRRYTAVRDDDGNVAAFICQGSDLRSRVDVYDATFKKMHKFYLDKIADLDTFADNEDDEHPINKGWLQLITDAQRQVGNAFQPKGSDLTWHAHIRATFQKVQRAYRALAPKLLDREFVVDRLAGRGPVVPGGTPYYNEFQSPSSLYKWFLDQRTLADAAFWAELPPALLDQFRQFVPAVDKDWKTLVWARWRPVVKGTLENYFALASDMVGHFGNVFGPGFDRRMFETQAERNVNLNPRQQDVMRVAGYLADLQRAFPLFLPESMVPGRTPVPGGLAEEGERERKQFLQKLAKPLGEGIGLGGFMTWYIPSLLAVLDLVDRREVLKAAVLAVGPLLTSKRMHQLVRDLFQTGLRAILHHSFLHRKIQKSGDLTGVDTRGYMQSLVDLSQKTYAFRDAFGWGAWLKKLQNKDDVTTALLLEPVLAWLHEVVPFLDRHDTFIPNDPSLGKNVIWRTAEALAEHEETAATERRMNNNQNADELPAETGSETRFGAANLGIPDTGVLRALLSLYTKVNGPPGPAREIAEYLVDCDTLSDIFSFIVDGFAQQGWRKTARFFQIFLGRRPEENVVDLGENWIEQAAEELEFFWAHFAEKRTLGDLALFVRSSADEADESVNVLRNWRKKGWTVLIEIVKNVVMPPAPGSLRGALTRLHQRHVGSDLRTLDGVIKAVKRSSEVGERLVDVAVVLFVRNLRALDLPALFPRDADSVDLAELQAVHEVFLENINTYPGMERREALVSEELPEITHNAYFNRLLQKLLQRGLRGLARDRARSVQQEAQSTASHRGTGAPSSTAGTSSATAAAASSSAASTSTTHPVSRSAADRTPVADNIAGDGDAVVVPMTDDEDHDAGTTGAASGSAPAAARLFGADLYERARVLFGANEDETDADADEQNHPDAPPPLRIREVWELVTNLFVSQLFTPILKLLDHVATQAMAGVKDMSAERLAQPVRWLDPDGPSRVLEDLNWRPGPGNNVDPASTLGRILERVRTHYTRIFSTNFAGLLQRFEKAARKKLERDLKLQHLAPNLVETLREIASIIDDEDLPAPMKPYLHRFVTDYFDRGTEKLKMDLILAYLQQPPHSRTLGKMLTHTGPFLQKNVQIFADKAKNPDTRALLQSFRQNLDAPMTWWQVWEQLCGPKNEHFSYYHWTSKGHCRPGKYDSPKLFRRHDSRPTGWLVTVRKNLNGQDTSDFIWKDQPVHSRRDREHVAAFLNHEIDLESAFSDDDEEASNSSGGAVAASSSGAAVLAGAGVPTTTATSTPRAVDQPQQEASNYASYSEHEHFVLVYEDRHRYFAKIAPDAVGTMAQGHLVTRMPEQDAVGGAGTTSGGDHEGGPGQENKEGSEDDHATGTSGEPLAHLKQMLQKHEQIEKDIEELDDRLAEFQRVKDEWLRALRGEEGSSSSSAVAGAGGGAPAQDEQMDANPDETPEEAERLEAKEVNRTPDKMWLRIQRPYLQDRLESEKQVINKILDDSAATGDSADLVSSVRAGLNFQFGRIEAELDISKEVENLQKANLLYNSENFSEKFLRTLNSHSSGVLSREKLAQLGAVRFLHRIDDYTKRFRHGDDDDEADLPEEKRRPAILTEFAEGMTLQAWALQAASEDNHDAVARISSSSQQASVCLVAENLSNLFRLWSYHALFAPSHTFFHGDPHPGNIMVHPETGKLTFIDFGFAFNQNTKTNLLAHFTQYVKGVLRKDVKAFQTLFNNLPEDDPLILALATALESPDLAAQPPEKQIMTVATGVVFRHMHRLPEMLALREFLLALGLFIDGFLLLEKHRGPEIRQCAAAAAARQRGSSLRRLVTPDWYSNPLERPTTILFRSLDTGDQLSLFAHGMLAKLWTSSTRAASTASGGVVVGASAEANSGRTSADAEMLPGTASGVAASSSSSSANPAPPASAGQ
ncbi:unnamed protein product [Amoebophrya sp. A120]|nr:unnamed protein product [Amoebophrya sp. A120]|eukprot:GSA120T00020051001.1